MRLSTFTESNGKTASSIVWLWYYLVLVCACVVIDTRILYVHRMQQQACEFSIRSESNRERNFIECSVFIGFIRTYVELVERCNLIRKVESGFLLELMWLRACVCVYAWVWVLSTAPYEYIYILRLHPLMLSIQSIVIASCTEGHTYMYMLYSNTLIWKTTDSIPFHNHR